jgi:hypothetical protein
MDMNAYLFEKLAEGRLAELRATGAQGALLASLRPARRGIRSGLGYGLIRAGRWIMRGPALPRQTASSAEMP